MARDVLLLVDRPGWAFDNIAKQLERRLSFYKFEICYTAVTGKKPKRTEYDSAICFWWSDERWLRKNGIHADRIYVGVYDHFSWQNDSFLIETATHADGIFCANEKLLREVGNSLRDGIRRCRHLWLCEDGVDVKLFPLLPLPAELVCGWAGNSTTSAGIKGVDIIREACDAEGVRLVVTDCSLEKLEDRVPHERMASEHYGKVSCQVCASSAEGTPNPVLEALSCGRPVLSTEVGIVGKVVRHGVNGFLVDRSVKSLRAGLRALKDETTRNALASHARASVIRSWSWERKVRAFDDMLSGHEMPVVAVVGAFPPNPEMPTHPMEVLTDSVAQEVEDTGAQVVRVGLPGLWRRADVLDRPPEGSIVVRVGQDTIPEIIPLKVETPSFVIGGAGPLDLSEEVTVFVTTIGAEDFPYCMDALARQDCHFRIRVISNVAPMDAAFQRMINECQTKYYVQVDEDMILYSDAVRKLYDAICAADPQTAVWFFGLHDVFTGLCLTGVKIYRHEIVREFPYQSVDYSCEVGHNERLKAVGYKIQGRYPGLHGNPRGESCVGDLNAHWTPWSVFEKYATDMTKLLRQPNHQGWMRCLPEMILNKLLKEPNEINLAAFLGCVVGLTVPDVRKGEKDFRNPSYRREFTRLLALCKIIEHR